MYDSDQFSDFYERKLEVHLQQLDEERHMEFEKVQRGRRYGIWLGLLLALLASVGVMALQEIFSLTALLGTFLILGIFCGLCGVVIGNHYTIKGMSRLYLPFKIKIVQPIINHLNPTLKYHPDERVSDQEVKDSQLFQEEISLYKGDDLIEGKEEDANFLFSELQLHVKVKKPDSDGASHWVHHPFFKGIFLVSEYPDFIIDNLIIRPNPDYSGGEHKDLFRKIMEKQSRWSKNRYTNWSPKKVHGNVARILTGDKAFDEQFLSYSSNEAKALEVIRSGLMDRLLVLGNMDHNKAFEDWQSGRSGGDFQPSTPYCSVIGNRLFLAKPYNRQFFNPNLEKSIVGPAETRKYYTEIVELTGIVRGVTEAFQQKQ